MALMGLSGQAWALAAAISVEGRWRVEGARLVVINVAPLTGLGVVLSVGWQGLDWSIVPGNLPMWACWVMLAWVPALLGLALAVQANQRRWSAMDVVQQPNGPSWLRLQAPSTSG